MNEYLDREMLHGNLETLVLASLARSSFHGYRLRQELAARSNDIFQVSFGRLYPLLDSLEKKSLITSHVLKVGALRERRIYSITATGLTELRERLRKWECFAAAMQAVLNPSS